MIIQEVMESHIET